MSDIRRGGRDGETAAGCGDGVSPIGFRFNPRGDPRRVQFQVCPRTPALVEATQFLPSQSNLPLMDMDNWICVILEPGPKSRTPPGMEHKGVSPHV